MLFRFLKWFFTVFIFDTKKESYKVIVRGPLPKGSPLIDYPTGKKVEWDPIGKKEYLL